jgi:hypothetical protein
MLRTKVIVFSAIVGLGVGVGAMYAGAFTPSPFKTTAPVSKVTATAADDRFCDTTATTLDPIKDMTVTFTQGSPASAVVVRFNGEFPKPTAGEIPGGSTAAGMFAFLTIDNVRVDLNSDNGGTLLHDGDTAGISNGTHGFEFVTKSIAPGSHTAKVFWLDNVLGAPGVLNGTMCVSDRTLVVEHH